jgi:hypothetical protein
MTASTERSPGQTASDIFRVQTDLVSLFGFRFLAAGAMGYPLGQALRNLPHDSLERSVPNKKEYLSLY